METKRGIDKAVATVVEQLKSQAKPVKGKQEIAQAKKRKLKLKNGLLIMFMKI